MRRLLLILALLLMIVPQADAQDPTASSCPQLVTLALQATDQACTGMGTNQACYGHMQIEAIPRLGIGDLNFEQAGDVAPLHAIETFRLSSMDPDTGTWGVALLNVMAYLQYAAPENVTFLLFGDVELDNETLPFTAIEVQVRPGYYANVRLNPRPNAGVLEVLSPGQVVEARARTEDSTWVLVELPESGRLGWVFLEVLSTEDDVEDLVIADGASTFYGPMQAFTMESGQNDAPCPESPESGLLIQTPEGVAEITLLVNEITIDMQATAFLQAQPNEDFSITVVDGWAEVEVNGQRQPVFAGSRVTVPLSETGAPSGAPSPPQPYELASLQSLPVGNLDSPVEVSAPLSPDAITAQMDQWQAVQNAVYGTTTQTAAATTGSNPTGSSPSGSNPTGSSPAAATDPITGEPVSAPPADGGSAPPPPDEGGSAPPPPDEGGGSGGTAGNSGIVPPGQGGDIPGKSK